MEQLGVQDSEFDRSKAKTFFDVINSLRKIQNGKTQLSRWLMHEIEEEYLVKNGYNNLLRISRDLLMLKLRK